MITRKPTISEAAKDSYNSSFNHVFMAMLLSLLFGIGWAFGFLSARDVDRDAYLTGQYLFSFLILTHAILQLILYLLRTSASREELSHLWYVATCRAQEYAPNSQTGQRSDKYIANEGTETIDLDEPVPKKAGDAPGSQAVVTTPLNGQSSTQSPSGAANQLAEDEDEDAVTSYTNKEAMETSDNKWMSE